MQHDMELTKNPTISHTENENFKYTKTVLMSWYEYAICSKFWLGTWIPKLWFNLRKEERKTEGKEDRKKRELITFWMDICVPWHIHTTVKTFYATLLKINQKIFELFFFFLFWMHIFTLTPEDINSKIWDPSNQDMSMRRKAGWEGKKWGGLTEK